MDRKISRTWDESERSCVKAAQRGEDFRSSHRRPPRSWTPDGVTRTRCSWTHHCWSAIVVGYCGVVGSCGGVVTLYGLTFRCISRTLRPVSMGVSWVFHAH
jgi:hypothetical protein